MALGIHDYPPSDAGPWRRYTSKQNDDQHVVPGFEGKRHVLAKECWCHPVIEIYEAADVVQPNVAQ